MVQPLIWGRRKVAEEPISPSPSDVPTPSPPASPSESTPPVASQSPSNSPPGSPSVSPSSSPSPSGSPFGSPSASPEWNPEDEKDAVLIFDGDKGITMDGANLTASWADQSISGCDVSQGVDNSKPLLVAAALNGHDYLEFDGIADFLSGCNFNTLIGDSGDLTLFVVFKCDNAGGRNESVFRASPDGIQEVSMHPKWSDNNAYYSCGNIGAGARATWVSTVGNWQIGCIVRDGSNVTGYVDGAQKAQVASNAYTSPTSAIVVGSFGAASNWFDGDIAYVYMGASAYNAPLLAQFVTWFQTRYAI